MSKPGALDGMKANDRRDSRAKAFSEHRKRRQDALKKRIEEDRIKDEQKKSSK